MSRFPISCFALAVVAASLVASCDSTVQLVPKSKMGYATVACTKGTGVKTIAPTLDMAASTYDVTFSRTGYTSRSLASQTTQSLASTSVELNPGAWQVAVQAYNAAATKIGEGSTTVTIRAGETTSANVTVSILSGTGTLSLSADWSTIAGSIGTPSLTGVLTPTSGTAITLPASAFTISGSTASYASSAIPSGSYTLTLILLNGANEASRATDAVQILAGQTASGTVSILKAENGSIGITITTNLPSAVTYAFNPSSGSTIAAGASIAATPSGAVSSYSWYLDGALSSTTTTGTYTTSGTLAAGTYYLTVIGLSGSYLSSGSMSFIIK
jgi:hypothetical protein